MLKYNRFIHTIKRGGINTAATIARQRPLSYPYVVRDVHLRISDELYSHICTMAATSFCTTLQDYLCFSIIRGLGMDGANYDDLGALPEIAAVRMPQTVDYVANIGTDDMF